MRAVVASLFFLVILIGSSFWFIVNSNGRGVFGPSVGSASVGRVSFFRCGRPWRAALFFPQPLSPFEFKGPSCRPLLARRPMADRSLNLQLLQMGPSSPANLSRALSHTLRERCMAPHSRSQKFVARFPHPRITRRSRLPLLTDGLSHRLFPFSEYPSASKTAARIEPPPPHRRSPEMAWSSRAHAGARI